MNPLADSGARSNSVSIEGLESLLEGTFSLYNGPGSQVMPTPEMVHDWTIDEAARSLKLSRGAILRKIESRELNGYRIPRPYGLAWRIKPILTDEGKQRSISSSTIIEPPPEKTNLELQSMLSLVLKRLAQALRHVELTAHRNGFLEARLNEQDKQLSLLNDYKLKAARAILLRRELEITEAKLVDTEKELNKIKDSFWYCPFKAISFLKELWRK